LLYRYGDHAEHQMAKNFPMSLHPDMACAVVVFQIRITAFNRRAYTAPNLRLLSWVRPIANAKRLLLIVSTNALNDGMVFEHSRMLRMIAIGRQPTFMETAKLTLSIRRVQKESPEIHALNLDGSPAERIPSSFKDGRLCFSIDTSKLKYATPFFEIEFVRQ